MLKSLFYFITLVVLTFSCSRGAASSDATTICDCYDSIHDESVRSESETVLEDKVKVCSEMLSSKLASFGANEEKKTSFMQEFRACQEN